MSQLKRDLQALQKQNKLGTSSGFTTKSNSHPKPGGTAKIGSVHPTGAKRSPQSVPKAKTQLHGVKYHKPVPTGKATPTAKVAAPGKSYKSMPGM